MASYPLDWQIVPCLEKVLHLFETQFEDFFVNIQEVESNSEGIHKRVIDISNNITSMHHFPKNIELKIGQKELIAKTKIRFHNLDKRLRATKTCLLVCNRNDSIDSIKEFLRAFSTLYPHLQIELLNVRNDRNLDSFHLHKEKIHMNEKLSITEYSFNDEYNTYTGEKFDWQGNSALWKEILNNYCTRSEMRWLDQYEHAHSPYVIYGAGYMCMTILKTFEKLDIRIGGIAVSDTTINPKMIGNYPVKSIEEYEKEAFILISLKDQCEAKKIKEMLIKKDYRNVFLFCDDMYREEIEHT